MAIALGKLKLSLSDFYELTPVELLRIYEKFMEDRMDFFESLQIANYVGFGQAFSGKKFKSVFKKKGKTQVRRVSLEEKMKDLADIQKKLGGV